MLSGTKLTSSVQVEAHPKVIEWRSSVEAAAAPTPNAEKRVALVTLEICERHEVHEGHD